MSPTLVNVLLMSLQLQWRHVAATNRNHVLRLGTGFAYYDLAFGISAEYWLDGRNRTTSSGITWTDCVYDARAGE